MAREAVGWVLDPKSNQRRDQGALSSSRTGAWNGMQTLLAMVATPFLHGQQFSNEREDDGAGTAVGVFAFFVDTVCSERTTSGWLILSELDSAKKTGGGRALCCTHKANAKAGAS